MVIAALKQPAATSREMVRGAGPIIGVYYTLDNFPAVLILWQRCNDPNQPDDADASF